MENKDDKYFINEFLSNERTFLSWIRTAVGILVFGFVTVKFSLFLKHIPTKNIQEIPIHISDYTVFMGFGFLIAGALIMLLAYWAVGLYLRGKFYERMRNRHFNDSWRSRNK